jgi:hypothetical protein
VPFRAWCIAVALFMFQGSAAQAASGTALGVDPAARLKSQSATQTLVVGTDISIGDIVTTDAGGSVQIKFFDGTELVVGPRSALVIQDYLLREDDSAGSMVLDALRGTFRFVTGSGPKDRYHIRTPNAVLAVRGTAFDFDVDTTFDPPRTSVLGYEGVVTMCDEAGNCADIGRTCEVGQSDGEGTRVLGIGRSATGMSASYFRKAFRYSVSETGLLPEFRIEGARDCSRRSAESSNGSDDQTDEQVGGPPDPDPDPDPEPPPPEPGGDCAGHSNPNPGNSQNCNK